jgi:hypothetical protein
MNKQAPDPVVKWVLIDPALAKEYLALNTENRPPKPVLVDRYAADLKNGKWFDTAPATPIAFTWSGNLINGQNRLMAIVKSGVSMKCQVMEGCDPKAFEFIDIGKNRDAGDNFYVEYKRQHGEAPKNHLYITSVARAMLIGLGGHTDPNKTQVKEHALKYYQFIQRYLDPLLKKTCHVFSSNLCAAFVNAEIWFGINHRDKLLVLAQRLGTGEWLGATDPMKILSDTIIRANAPRISTHQKTLTREESYGITVNAIRNALNNKVIKRIEPTKQEWGSIEMDLRIKKKAS